VVSEAVRRSRFTGLRAWWVQRLSALYLLLFTAFVLVSLSAQPIHAYPQWRAWMARPSTSLALMVFVAALLAHMWVGLRDVLLDYARPAGLRATLLVAVAGGLLGIGGWLSWVLLALHA
jgi:succinate dehydrogenase / fumarate reductase membrane anchor subunit